MSYPEKKLAPEASHSHRRSATWGMIPDVVAQCASAVTLEMYSTYSLIRQFELRVRQAQTDKDVECLIYLSLGQEAIATGVAAAMPGSWVLAQHRGHAAYLAFGGDRVRLADELLGLPSGCCRGVGGSPPVHDLSRKIVGHCGLIGDQVPVAVGVALGRPGEKVTCFFGDGAAEEDYVLSALSYAASFRLPILFVCDDNDLSVLTPTASRRTWLLEDVAKAFGMPAVDITDDPWLVRHHAARLSGQLPALMNVRTCRNIWHVGTGSDGAPEWDRHALIKRTMRDIGLEREAIEIEKSKQLAVESLWKERLQIKSAS